MSNNPEIRFKIVTIFPEFFESPFRCGVLGKANKRGLIEVSAVDLRDFSEDKHKKVDDTPYGGGDGMVMRPDPFYRAMEALKEKESHVILTDPCGELLTSRLAEELSNKRSIIILCGRYEGVDERVKNFVDRTVSIGPYILSGGEYAALCMIDAISRFIPEVVGNPDSIESDSFRDGGAKYPQYTKPRIFKGHRVPEVLLSGDHKRIASWREKMAKERDRKFKMMLKGCLDWILRGEEDPG